MARQDSGWNGAFGKTRFYVSDSKDSFPEKPTVEVTFAKERKAQEANCDGPTRGRYVRVVVSSGVNKGPWASAAEIGVIEAKD